jgi:hypothetical protein
MTVPSLIVPLVVLLASCSSPSPSANTVQLKDTTATQASALLQSNDLRVLPTVDSLDVINHAAIGCLRRFFAQKLLTDAPNDYWSTSDLDRCGPIDSELFYAEYDEKGELRYPPTLMSIRRTDVEDERILRVRWAAIDSGGAVNDARYVFDFLARRTAEGVRLFLPVEHNTRAWERRTVGTIQYILSPEHTFSVTEAQEQVAAIGRLSDFFGLEPFPITYYACTDPAELFRMKGFQHHVLMHTYPTGGRADTHDRVYAGNNKDIYTHEVVHLFSGRMFSDASPLLDEGLATLLGGSNEHNYAWHRANMARYLKEHPAMDLSQHCNTHLQEYTNGDTSIPYMIGALLCERVLRREGKAGLFQVLSRGSDPWPLLAPYGITPENLTVELVKEVGQPAPVFR